MAARRPRRGGARLADYLSAISVLADRFIWSRSMATLGAPHVRDRVNVQRVLNNFVLASLPCWLIGLWNLGEQIHVATAFTGTTELPGWRAAVLAGLGLPYDGANLAANFLHGLLYWLPIFLAALLTGAVWEAVFAVIRQRPVDEGLLSIAWLFALILPPTVPLYQVVICMTFAMVVAKGIYGGDGSLHRQPAGAWSVHSHLLVSGDAAWDRCLDSGARVRGAHHH